MKKLLMDKKGIGIGDIYPIVLTVAVTGILLAVVLYVMNRFGVALPNGSAAQNATDTLTSQFVAFLPWIGIILLIVAAAIVLGIVISSFAGRRGV